MRSVSIVYKKPKKQLPYQPVMNSMPIRRSVDQYYTRLHQKGEKKNNQQDIRTHTSSNIRKKIHQNFKSSFNIVKLQHKNASPIHSKPVQNQNTLSKALLTRKNTSNFFSFKAPSHDNFINEINTKDTGQDKGCKLKALFNLPRNKLRQTTVVISVDFILNEMNFWQQQGIQEGSVKAWKTIQNIANIVWIVRRQNSLQKIKAYIKQNNLNADGVYLVMPKKSGKTLSVSYSALQKDLKLDQHRKLIIINGLRVENVSQLHYSIFLSLVPQIKHSESFIHFVKLDINQSNRFNDVLKVLSKKLPHSTNINSIFRQFYQEHLAIDVNSKSQNIIRKNVVDHQFMLQRVETLKKNYCNYLSRVVGVRKGEGEQSIPYIVGDMLKRNFQFLTLLYKNENQKQRSQQIDIYNQDTVQKLKYSLLSKSKSFEKSKTYYNRPVYIWSF